MIWWKVTGKKEPTNNKVCHVGQKNISEVFSFQLVVKRSLSINSKCELTEMWGGFWIILQLILIQCYFPHALANCQNELFSFL